ncbi:MAG TPA: gliding motility lipoprotein GldH [Flavobacteriaceae bacterium]|nr:gliding motility lipoprotein GldH [Flavobacteriaceae bacterium]|tara:strand:+ start:609 stop:1091 length:483 start_codon:yes stop_codon:yes gene_type:complete
MIYRLCLIIIAIVFTSCRNEVLVNQYNSLPMSWHKDSILKFNFQIKDSSERYNTYIKVRLNNEYMFNNIFIIATLENSKGLLVVDTLEYPMTTNQGELIGRKFINIVENKLLYKENFSIDKDVEYQLTLKHAMRLVNITKGLESLEGILDIGYSIEKILD